MLYLEDGDAVAAETYIKKASSLLSSCKVGPAWAAGRARCGSRLPGGRPQRQLKQQLKQQQRRHFRTLLDSTFTLVCRLYC